MTPSRLANGGLIDAVKRRCDFTFDGKPIGFRR